MKHLLTIATLFFLAAGFHLNAQTSSEPEKSAGTQVTGTSAGCHGAAMKPGCCKAGEQAKAGCESHGRKSKKNKKDCCAQTGSANCCANKGEHAGQACHPGCTMPCCQKKEENKD